MRIRLILLIFLIALIAYWSFSKPNEAFQTDSKIASKVDSKNTEEERPEVAPIPWPNIQPETKLPLPENASSEQEELNFHPNALEDEITLHFSDKEKLREYIDLLPAERLLGTIDSLNAVRIAMFGDPEDSEFIQAARDRDAGPSFSFPISFPAAPREETITGNTAFGANILEWLGINIDNSTWGKGVTIAVIDSEVMDHETFYESDISRVSIIKKDPSAKPAYHGTAVTSAITSRGKLLRGVAPAASILSIEVIDASGSGSTFAVADGIVEAVNRGAKVINISLGSSNDARLLKEAVRYATEQNVAIVAAAGNEEQGLVPFPSRYPDVIAVSSVDANSLAAGFVNTSDMIDIAAPGVGIFVAYDTKSVARMNGTSISTPFVSGTIAALLSLERNLTLNQIKEIFQSNSNDQGMPGHDSIYGDGVLNVKRIIDRNTPGIYDVAIADHIVDRERSTNDEVILLITVENRGTQKSTGVKVTYNIDNKKRTDVLGALNPRELKAIEVSLDKSQFNNPKGVTIESRLTAKKDAVLNNNYKKSIIVFAPK